MIIPRKQPPQSKAEVRAAFADFAVLHDEVHTDYGCAIEVVQESWARTVFLKLLGGAGADPVEARMLHAIGADNTFLQKSEEEQERLTDIANEVATSPDVLLCHSDLVEGITDGNIEDCRDPVVIAFYSFVFHECTWTPTAMFEYEDSFELTERKMFVLVRDVNSPTLQRFNQEIVRLDGAGALTLSTPLEEHNRNPRDSSSWRRYENTPWPLGDADTDERITEGWTPQWPRVENGNMAYNMLLHRMDEMNDYKNRLVAEVERLTIENQALRQE